MWMWALGLDLDVEMDDVVREGKSLAGFAAWNHDSCHRLAFVKFLFACFRSIDGVILV